jgi:ANTAR domain
LRARDLPRLRFGWANPGSISMTDEPQSPDSIGNDAVGAETLCQGFVDTLPVTGASVAMLDTSGGQSTVCSSDDLALRLDSLQFNLGEGPRWEAMRTGGAVLAGSLDGDAVERWPIFAATVLGWGVKAVYAFPLRLGAITIGTVDLYCVEQGDLHDEQVALATKLTTRITPRAIRLAVQLAETEGADLGPSPTLRRAVHQATGILIVQLDTSATEAFLRLRAHAFANSRTVEDVAHDVVRGVLDFSLLAD